MGYLVQSEIGPNTLTLAATSSFVYARPQTRSAWCCTYTMEVSRPFRPNCGTDGRGCESASKISAIEQYCSPATGDRTIISQSNVPVENLLCHGLSNHIDGNGFPSFGAVEKGLKVSGRCLRQPAMSAASASHLVVLSCSSWPSASFAKQKLITRASM
jgi:hypothetical protein